jgi:seryl-tRNA synthetase
MGIKKRKGKYLFTEVEAKRILDEPEPNPNEPETITQEFTAKEYERLQNIIKDYDTKAKEVERLLEQVEMSKNHIEYFKQSLDRKNKQMDKLLETFKQTTKSIQQRNYIELSEKKRNEE